VPKWHKGLDDITITVDPSRANDHGKWEGWGTSLCWWAAVPWETPNPKVIADLLFTTKDVIPFQTTTHGSYDLPGLGMTIARYNAGASGPGMKEGKLYPRRKIAGFWTDRTKGDPSTWEWERDLQQIDMLRAAKERGANLFELFANSPMWWMCHTECPAGSLSGIKDNLKKAHYKDFAHYLVSIALYAKSTWGIEFKYIAPFNEPSSDWWKMSNNQEGCRFGHASQSVLLKELNDLIAYKMMTENSSQSFLRNLELAASDENQYDQAIDTWDSLDDAARATISKINVHGYQERGGERQMLYEQASSSGKRLWNSEYGDGDATGLSLAQNLNLDFHRLHPTAWVYWQALDSGAWGLVEANPKDRWAGHPNAKLFVLAHYSRHIRPGMRILHVECEDKNSVAAYSDDEKKLVLVSLNPWHVVHCLKYDLSRFQLTGDNAEVKCWSTDIDAACVTCGKATRKPMAYIEEATNLIGTDLQFYHWFDSKTIKTFEIFGLEPKSRR
jgi:galactan endo-1,6-beta-galactosidase